MDSATLSPVSRSMPRIEVQFEDLPNLPKPVIPKIDLDIKRIELEDLLLIKPSTSFRKVGYSVGDNGTQTDQSDILDLKYVTEMLRTLTLDTGQLRKDLTFARSMLKANYEKQISDRSAELYCRVNERLCNYELLHKKKMETIRKSYQTQLEDAIKAVAGDYKMYYNEILQGKTGRHDIIIQDLKDLLSQQELLTRQHEAKIDELENRLHSMEETDANKTSSPVPEIPGITAEEAEEMEGQIESLKDEVIQLKTDLAIQEDENNELNKEIDSLNKQLNDQKTKYKQLEKDIDSFKKKTKQEKEKAAKLAENQLAVMEKEMKSKREQAEKEAAEKAQEQAELQRMRDQAKYQEEIVKRKSMEDQLRAEAAVQSKPTEIISDDKGLMAEIEALRDIEKKHKNIISRLEKELDKTNKMWELKLMVMRKNFHSLKDEFFIRNTLKRQSAALQHSTVGYAISGDMCKDSHHTNHHSHHSKHQTKEIKAIPNLKFNTYSTNSRDDRVIKSPLLKDCTPTIPPPSPNNLIVPQSPRVVHFGDEFPPAFQRPFTKNTDS